MKIRAIVDGKVMYGQHYISGSGQHYVLINTSHRIHFASPILVRIESGQWLIEFIKIDPATAAVFTGRQDKTGKDIYGSKGDMLGGDSVDYGPAIGVIKWSDDNAQWRICWAELDLAFNHPLVSRGIIILKIRRQTDDDKS